MHTSRTGARTGPSRSGRTSWTSSPPRTAPMVSGSTAGASPCTSERIQRTDSCRKRQRTVSALATRVLLPCRPDWLPGAHMIFYDYYADVTDADVADFVSRQKLGRLVTVSADGQPHIGLYPFLFLGDRFEIHLHRSDEQLADLAANARCAFELDEVLGAIPSHWIHPTNAMFATAYHRTVIFECEAVVSDDPEVLAAQQRRLMAHYQPDGHTVVSTEHAMYRGPFKEISALTLHVHARKVKWKLAQNRTREQREAIIAELRKRGRPADAGAADALQWTLDHE